MSAVGQWRVALQEMPEYSDGADAFARGEPNHCFILTGDAKTAWQLGWTDAQDDTRPRLGEE